MNRLEPEGAGRRLDPSHLGFDDNRIIDRIDERAHYSCRGEQLVQHLQPLRSHLHVQRRYTGEVAARPVQAGDKPQLDGIRHGQEDNRNGRGRCFCSQRGKGGAASGDHGRPTVNQVLRQPRQAVILIVGPAILDRHVPALHVTPFIQAEMERAHEVVELVARGRIEETNDRHPGLLRARHERPRSSTAEL